MEPLMSGLVICALAALIAVILVKIIFGFNVFAGIDWKIFAALWTTFMLIAIGSSWYYELKILMWILLTSINGAFIASIVAHRYFARFRKIFIYWFKAFGIFWIIYQGVFFMLFETIYWKMNWYLAAAICIVSIIHVRITSPKN